MKPLFAVRDCLREQGMATASQLAATLSLSRGMIEDMLDYWQRRGRVERLVSGNDAGCGSACGSGGGCSGCGPPATDNRTGMTVYRWRDSVQTIAPAPQPVTFYRAGNQTSC